MWFLPAQQHYVVDGGGGVPQFRKVVLFQDFEIVARLLLNVVHNLANES
jgi:hypothetical protein